MSLTANRRPIFTSMPQPEWAFKPTEALVIDDSPSGIEGASAAGIRSLGFIGTNRLGKPWETALMAAGAQDLISSFDELLLKLGLCGKFQSCTNDNTASL